jgi:hypothetical protein
VFATGAGFAGGVGASATFAGAGAAATGAAGVGGGVGVVEQAASTRAEQTSSDERFTLTSLSKL